MALPVLPLQNTIHYKCTGVGITITYGCKEDLSSGRSILTLPIFKSTEMCPSYLSQCPYFSQTPSFEPRYSFANVIATAVPSKYVLCDHAVSTLGEWVILWSLGDERDSSIEYNTVYSILIKIVCLPAFVCAAETGPHNCYGPSDLLCLLTGHCHNLPSPHAFRLSSSQQQQFVKCPRLF